MLEVTPPQRRAKPEAVESVAERIKQATTGLKAIDFLNVPEITEENYAGMPLFKNMDSAEFAAMLSKKTRIEAVVNKVTPFFSSEIAFRSWLEDCIATYKIHHFVLVGGSNNTRKYPGPPVIRADQIASEMGKVKVGNICIPSRDDEAERLAAKTEAGATFFTTQMIFEPKSMERVLEEYASRCESRRVKPAAFFVSLAPASTHFDIDFFKWLGAEIPEKLETKLRKSAHVMEDSIALATGIFSEIMGFAKERGIKLEIAANVEAVSTVNLDHACKIINGIIGNTQRHLS